MKKNLHIIFSSLIFSLLLWGSISLSSEYYATVEMPVKLTGFPEGYSSGTNLPDNIQLKVKAYGWRLLALTAASENEFVVPAGKDSGKKFIDLFNYLTDNSWFSSDIQIMDISPDTLVFNVERIARKFVRVVTELDLSFNSGYGLATAIKVVPESTQISGPASLISKIDTIFSIHKIFKKLDDKLIDRVPLKKIRSVSFSDNIVSIELNVQKIVDRELENLLVDVIDMPADRDVLLVPNKINVGLRGGIEILGRLNESSIRPFVLFRDVVTDTVGSILPSINLPHDVNLVYTKPERLRYIIKKF